MPGISKRSFVLGWLLGAAAMSTLGNPRAFGATIQVTSTQQKISGTGGCSLQEAIWAANFDASSALVAASNEIIATECTAGDGDDVIVLPENGFFPMLAVLDDDYNPFGPTATPIILSNITIEANGSLLQRGANTPTFRAFAVATAAFVEIGDLPIAGDGLGSLTIRNAHIRGFAMKGGNGRGGGGGGMGAGGAIFVKDGTLTVENSAFEGNFAEGGRGGIQFIPHPGGGGGGLSGNGGRSSLAVDDADIGPGGGGGGARGDGGDAGLDGGGGGGGTLVDGQPGTLFGGSGGRRCGGLGENQDDNGGRARCPGGGGGGAGEPSLFAGIPQGGDGGAGGYGGGGGGAGGAGSADVAGRDGGRGGFGGGGGGGGGGSNGTGDHGDGGSGGFGGGGGSGYDEPGGGGLFGGDGTTIYGGGGAALGGAIFAHQATITIRNCTFNGNFVVRGLSGCGTECPGTQHKGADLGAAVFALMGSVAISNSTVSGNDNTGSFGGVVYLNIKLEDPLNTPPGFFTLRNTIIAHNGVNFDAPAECAIAGANMTVAGSGNLIMRNATAADDALPCPGVTSTADPQLGTLRLNAPGNTPTMLPTLDSPAIDAADAATSLAEDQRGRTRPQRDGFDIGAVEVNPDFAISATSPLIGTPGDTLRAQVTVTSIDGFNTAVPLSVFGGGPPPGFTVTFDATTLTPVAGGTASTFASIKIGETVVPGAYTLIVQGTFGGMNRGVGVSITVATTTASMGRTIDAYRTENCIDSSGVATAFKAKLANASALHDQGRDQASNNALSALLYQIGAQSGRHVRTTCQVGGVTTDPSAVLTAGVQYLLSTEATGILNPVMGSVMKTGGSEIAGATVSIYAGKKLVASSSTDVTGFYYFADTSQLMRGVAYAAKLTSVPSGLKSTQAPTQSFTWNGRAVVLGNLVLK